MKKVCVSKVAVLVKAAADAATAATTAKQTATDAKTALELAVKALGSPATPAQLDDVETKQAAVIAAATEASTKAAAASAAANAASAAVTAAKEAEPASVAAANTAASDAATVANAANAAAKASEITTDSKVAVLVKAAADAATAATTAKQRSAITLADLQGLKYKTVFNGNGAGTITWTVTDHDPNAVSMSLSESLTITVDPVRDRHSGGVTMSLSALPPNLMPTSGLTTSGMVNYELAASNSLADVDGWNGVVNYQWYANGTVISGATNSTYLVTTNEVGKYITVVASFTDNGGELEQARSVIDLGGGGLGQLIAPVKIDGKWYYFWDRSHDGTATLQVTGNADDTVLLDATGWTHTGSVVQGDGHTYALYSAANGLAAQLLLDQQMVQHVA